MNREPANKSLGFFSIYKEAYKITVSWKKLFSQITLSLILPLTILYLSDIHISDFIISKAYPNNVQAKWIVYGTTSFVYLILILLLFFFSTCVVACCVSCFYTSKDTTFKKVIRVVPKVWGRLLVTFLLLVFILGIVAIVYLALILCFAAKFNGPEGEGRYKVLAFVICQSVPFFIGLVYITSVWNIAMVIAVLEKSYGAKAMVKSVKLIKGKIWISCAVFLALEIVFAGITFTYSLLVVAGDILDLVGEVFVGIVCYLLATILIHFSLVIQTVVYFVCKAYHNEDISNVAAHLDKYCSRINQNRLRNPHPYVLFVINFYRSLYCFLFLCLQRYQVQESYDIVYFGLLLGFMGSLHGSARLALIICLTIPYLIVLIYISVVWNLAMVISVLEKHYGITALKKSKTLIYGKIWVSVAVFIALEIISIGIIFALSLLVVFDGSALNLVGKIFVGIVCYLLAIIMFHFSLVTQAVIYFVCKAYHNEDISEVAAHLDNSYVNLVGGNAVPV
ncbi:hypothetical protein MKX01_005241 [Papaver californicum]|nr:hypothetical protein MKX01_005241 [Papaver californicum]